MTRSARRVAAWVGLLTLPVGCGTRAAPGRYEFAEIIMGVKARVALYADDAASARVAARAAFDRMIELEAVMSDYRRDSELMQVCAAAPGQPHPVSDDLFAVLARAKAIAEASGGAFDPTLGPMVGLWREARVEGRRPDPEALAAARERCGWRAMTLDPAARTLTLARPGMRLDLGGIGKGFAADEARQRLAAIGAPRCLVDLGGDIAIGDPPPGRKGWRVGVANGSPGQSAGRSAGRSAGQSGGSAGQSAGQSTGQSPGQSAAQSPGHTGREAGAASDPVLRLANVAIALSSDEAQHVEIDGVRYSHILDPSTGLGVTARRAVAVIACDGATADALASAVSVLGAERGLRLVAQFPGAAARIETGAGDRREERRSLNWPVLLNRRLLPADEGATLLAFERLP